jgi:hypothetical protein
MYIYIEKDINLIFHIMEFSIIHSIIPTDEDTSSMIEPNNFD